MTTFTIKEDIKLTKYSFTTIEDFIEEVGKYYNFTEEKVSLEELNGFLDKSIKSKIK